MNHLYYIFGIIFIVYEIIWIFYSKTNIETFVKVSKWFRNHKRNPKSFEHWPLYIKRYTIFTVIAVLFFLAWVYTGFFSEHRKFYFIYIFFQLFIFLPISYFLKPTTKIYHVVHIICAIITIIFLALILNAQYSHISLLK